MEALNELMKALVLVAEAEDNKARQRRAALRSARRAAVLQKNEEMRSKADEESGETAAGLEECSMRVLMDIDNAVRKLASEDRIHLVEGVIAIRRILSVENAPPIAEVVGKGALPILVWALDYPDDTVQFEAAWALTNVASGPNCHVLSMLKFGTVEKLVEKLSCPNRHVAEQAVWALGNVAGDSYECRDFVLAKCGLEPLARLASAGASSSLRRNATWAVSNLFRGQPPPLQAMLLPSLPVVCSLLGSDDPHVRVDAMWCLSYFSNGGDERILRLLEQGVLPQVVQIMTSHSKEIHTPALRVVGNVATGPDHMVEPLLDMGVLPALAALLQHAANSTKREIFWTLSNITAGDLPHVRRFVESPLFMATISCVRTECNETVAVQALWALANATSHVADAGDLLDLFLESGLVDALYSKITSLSDRTKAVALEGTSNCLKACGTSLPNKVAQRLKQIDNYSQLLELEYYDGAIGEHAANMLELVGCFLETP